jgi:hypothetical protein
MSVNLLQPLNTLSPVNWTTFAGHSIFVIVEFLKAFAAMGNGVTAEVISTSSIHLQFWKALPKIPSTPAPIVTFIFIAPEE